MGAAMGAAAGDTVNVVVVASVGAAMGAAMGAARGEAMGVAIGRDGTHRGVLASLFNAKRLEDIWLDAADDDFLYASINGEERIPCDVWHGLGIFYRLVPDSWIVKLLAGTKGSLDKSLEFHTKSNNRPLRFGGAFHSSLGMR